MNCSYCNKPITLSPSAKERAAKYGKSVKYYERLFTQHAECILKQRHTSINTQA